MGKTFEDLRMWQLGRELVNEVYKFTRGSSFRNDQDLSRQMRRAAISIISNIAEGYERNSNREFSRYLLIAKGSCGELRAQCYIAQDQEYGSTKLIIELCNQCSRMIEAYRLKLVDSTEHYVKEEICELGTPFEGSFDERTDVH
jgi:four helix bundle protein